MCVFHGVVDFIDWFNIHVFADKPGPLEDVPVVSDVWADHAKLSWKPPKEYGGCEITGEFFQQEEQVRNGCHFTVPELSMQ